MAALYRRGSTISRLQSHYEETINFLPLSPQEILVLISEIWKAEQQPQPSFFLFLVPFVIHVPEWNQFA